MGYVLGRDEQWSRVDELLTGAAAGQRTALLVDGAPGTGRTTLLRAAVAAATRRGLPVTTNLPGATLSPRDQDALVAVDDFDRLTPELRAAVSAAPAAGWLLTGRCHADFAEFTAPDVPTCTATLGPLDQDIVRRLVAGELGAAADPGVLALVTGAGGNPLLLTALLAGLREEGVRRLPDRADTPHRLRDLVRRRLRTAPVESWRLLRVAAVLGRSCQVAELTAMTRQATAELLPAVDALLDAGVLDWAADDLTFRHELVWWAVLDAVPRAVRNALLDDRDRIKGAGFDDLPRANRAVLPAPAASDLHCARANLLLLKGESAAARAAAEQVLATPGVDGRLADEATAVRVTAMALGGDPAAEQTAETILANAQPTSTATVAAALVLSNVVVGQGTARGRTADIAAPRQRRRGRDVPALVAVAAARADQQAERGGAARRGQRADADHPRRDGRAEPPVVRGQPGHRGGAPAAGGRAADARRGSGRRPVSRPRGTPACRCSSRTDCPSWPRSRWPTTTSTPPRRGSRRPRPCWPAPTACATPLYSWVSLRLTARRHGPGRAAKQAAAELASGSPLLVAEQGAAAWLVRLATAAGDAELARRVVTTAERLAVANPGFATLAAAAAEAKGGRPGPPPPAATTWESLSSVERAIAALVAQGMTNRQIATRVRLSPHTVNYHLRGMFRKLDVSSRAELVRHVPAAA